MTKFLVPLLLISSLAQALPEHQEKAINNLREYLTNIDYEKVDAHICFCCLNMDDEDEFFKLHRPKVIDRKIFGVLWSQMCIALNLTPDYQQKMLDDIAEFSCPCCIPPSGLFRSFVRLACCCGIPNGCCCQDCHYNGPTRRPCGFYVIDRDLAITALNTLEMQVRNRETSFDRMKKHVPPGMRPREDVEPLYMDSGV